MQCTFSELSVSVQRVTPLGSNSGNTRTPTVSCFTRGKNSPQHRSSMSPCPCRSPSVKMLNVLPRSSARGDNNFMFGLISQSRQRHTWRRVNRNRARVFPELLCSFATGSCAGAPLSQSRVRRKTRLRPSAARSGRASRAKEREAALAFQLREVNRFPSCFRV